MPQVPEPSDRSAWSDPSEHTRVADQVIFELRAVLNDRCGQECLSHVLDALAAPGIPALVAELSYFMTDVAANTPSRDLLSAICNVCNRMARFGVCSTQIAQLFINGAELAGDLGAVDVQFDFQLGHLELLDRTNQSQASLDLAQAMLPAVEHFGLATQYGLRFALFPLTIILEEEIYAGRRGPAILALSKIETILEAHPLDGSWDSMTAMVACIDACAVFKCWDSADRLFRGAATRIPEASAASLTQHEGLLLKAYGLCLLAQERYSEAVPVLTDAMGRFLRREEGAEQSPDFIASARALFKCLAGLGQDSLANAIQASWPQIRA